MRARRSETHASSPRWTPPTGAPRACAPGAASRTPARPFRRRDRHRRGPRERADRRLRPARGRCPRRAGGRGSRERADQLSRRRSPGRRHALGERRAAGTTARGNSAQKNPVARVRHAQPTLSPRRGQIQEMGDGGAESSKPAAVTPPEIPHSAVRAGGFSRRSTTQSSGPFAAKTPQWATVPRWSKRREAVRPDGSGLRGVPAGVPMDSRRAVPPLRHLLTATACRGRPSCAKGTGATAPAQVLMDIAEDHPPPRPGPSKPAGPRPACAEARRSEANLTGTHALGPNELGPTHWGHMHRTQRLQRGPRRQAPLRVIRRDAIAARDRRSDCAGGPNDRPFAQRLRRVPVDRNGN